MNPLRVLWLQGSRRVRLFHAWLLVQIGLHREAPSSIRHKLVKLADWLEATLELIAEHSQNHPSENSTAMSPCKIYKQLKEEVAALNPKGSNSHEELSGIQTKFLALLDLCAIKDANIPPLAQQPTPVRFSNKHPLITGLGIMSNGTSPRTPQRLRHARRDPSTYADMLIEQLMAQQNNSVSDSSDTSPPSDDKTSPTPSSTIPIQRLGDGNNNEKKEEDSQTDVRRGRGPQRLTLSHTTVRSSSMSTPKRPSPPQVASGSVAHRIRAATEWMLQDHETVSLVKLETAQSNPILLAQQVISDCELQSHQYATTDSGITGSEYSHTITTTATVVSRPTSRSSQTTLKSAAMPLTSDSGSTPELPTSGSSDSLDIQFASMFDEMECPDAMLEEFSGRSSDYPQINPGSPDAPESNCFNFPTTYSESYARELQMIETQTERSMEEMDSFSKPPSPYRSLPTPASTPNILLTPSKPVSNLVPQQNNDKDSYQFVFHEPLVVCLPPPKTEPRLSSLKFTGSGHGEDYNLDNNYKPHLGDKKAEFISDDEDVRPPIPPRRPLTDSKLGKFVVRSESSHVGTLWLQGTPCQVKLPPLVNSPNVPLLPSPASQKSEICQVPSMLASPSDPAKNMSWSYYDLPSSNPTPSVVQSADRQRQDRFITSRHQRHSPSPPEIQAAVSSASKRRRGNNMPVGEDRPAPARSARQRLSFTPLASGNSYSPSSPVNTPTESRLRRKKRQSPAMRRLMQQKENIAISPTRETGSPNRKPLNDLNNIRGRDSFVLTTSSNSLTPSSEAYAKSSDTSPDFVLPSREEELLDRDAHYCDFTVDRQQKIDSAKKEKKVIKHVGKFSSKHCLILEDSQTTEIIVRQVEGAESSPTSNTNVFQVPPSTMRAPKSLTAQRRLNQQYQQAFPSPSTSAHKSRTPRLLERTTSARKPSTSPASSVESRASDQPQSSRKSSRSSSRSSSHRSKSCNSHPIASSTLIMEYPDSISPEVETGSVYTWSIDEESGPCNLEKSYLRSTKKAKKPTKPKTPRPSTSVGKDRERKPENKFEISAMVSAFDKTHRYSVSDSLVDDTITYQKASKRSILAAAPSFIRKLGKSRNSSSNSQVSEPSSAASNQVTTSSLFLNRAKGSIVCSSSDPSENQEQMSYPPTQMSELPSQHIASVFEEDSSFQQSDDFNNLTPAQARRLSVSDPVLPNHYYDDDTDEEEEERRRQRSVRKSRARQSRHYTEVSANCTSYIDTEDETTETSPLSERLEVPGKSSSSNSSACTAARCRPRSRNTGKQVEQSSAECGLLETPTAPPPATNQDLLDSILTDSPKSVDSSGIFAPYNSYNSPVESVGSHNGYSSTVSSSLTTSSDPNYLPPNTPAAARNLHCTPKRSEVQPTDTESDSVFKRPFNPKPHVSIPQLHQLTRNQGTSAAASPRSSSVRSDPLANKSIFAVPPGVVTGPPKIKDKKSLVKKLKKFSSNFYKKTEKIQTLANL